MHAYHLLRPYAVCQLCAMAGVSSVTIMSTSHHHWSLIEMHFQAYANLGNELVVGHRHGDGAEQLLQVVGQARAAAIALACRVERDKDARAGVHLHGPSHKVHGGGTLLQSALQVSTS